LVRDVLADGGGNLGEIRIASRGWRLERGRKPLATTGRSVAPAVRTVRPVAAAVPTLSPQPAQT
jgi:hypothetical protein